VNNRVDKNTIQNGKITYYYCQGIWCCPNCPWTLRACVKSKAFTEQYESQCTVCTTSLVHLECNATVTTRESEKSIIYEHYGTHTHPQPTGSRVHPQQYEEFKTVVQNNPSTSSHRLQVGTSFNFSTGEGNSITNIAPQFHNSGTASYYRRKALTQSGNIITSTTGSDTFIADFRTLQLSLPNYVRRYEFDPTSAIISVQTLWMEEMFSVKKSDIMTETGMDPASSNICEMTPMIFRHGCITDAANKYFRLGIGIILTLSR
jgi:hypothetical protein